MQNGEKKVMLWLKGREEPLEGVFSIPSARGVGCSDAGCTWICKQMGSGTAGNSPAEQLCMGNNSLVFNGQEKRVENKLNYLQRINPAFMQ